MIERISATSYQRMVWKNGLGVTDEIAVAPAGATLASGFSYRISRAQVTAGGAFSAFAGCDRILTVISGEGLSLTRGTETKALAPLEPFRFSGDEPVSATLAHGPITDFNVIFDRARVDASCTRFGATVLAEHPGTERFLYCVSGALVCDGVTLEQGDSARVIGETLPKIVAQTASTVALHVRLWPR